jgi:protein-S-isoprenylcysteine O-methyltransferase Ste14
MLISVPASALAIRSWVALVPAACFVLVIMRRAQLEDEFLEKNLPGYVDYVRRVPAKLFPAKRVFRSFYAQHKP